MPTYDYRCSGGHRYEKREPFGSPSEHACERCGKPAKRVLHAPPVVFKGSGWYQTDSRSRSRGRSSSESSEKKRESEAATAERKAKSGSSKSSSSGGDSGAPMTSNGSKPD